jgi:hypothetical protein
LTNPVTGDFQEVQLVRDAHTLTLRLRLRGDTVEIDDFKYDAWGGWSGEYLAV